MSLSVSQSIARGLFQLLRQDQKFLSLDLVLRDENFSSNLMFRDKSEIFFHQSRASRREREFLLSVSFFETRMRISVFTLVLPDENENNVEKQDTVCGGVG